MAKHWIVFAQAVYTLLNFLDGYTHFLCHSLLSFNVMRNKLMEWGIEQTYVDWISVHSLQNAIEILLLIRQ